MQGGTHIVRYMRHKGGLVPFRILCCECRIFQLQRSLFDRLLEVSRLFLLRLNQFVIDMRDRPRLLWAALDGARATLARREPTHHRDDVTKRAHYCGGDSPKKEQGNR